MSLTVKERKNVKATKQQHKHNKENGKNRKFINKTKQNKMKSKNRK